MREQNYFAAFLDFALEKEHKFVYNMNKEQGISFGEDVRLMAKRRKRPLRFCGCMNGNHGMRVIIQGARDKSKVREEV